MPRSTCRCLHGSKKGNSTETGSIRDDLAVLTAIAMRQDGTLGALLNEVRAMHSQHSRLANRVRDMEART